MQKFYFRSQNGKLKGYQKSLKISVKHTFNYICFSKSFLNRSEKILFFITSLVYIYIFLIQTALEKMSLVLLFCKILNISLF
jgi:hypothetical protein